MTITRLVITLRVIADVDLAEVIDDDDLDPDLDDAAGHYADQLAGFLDNEVNNCAEMPGNVGVMALSYHKVGQVAQA